MINNENRGPTRTFLVGVAMLAMLYASIMSRDIQEPFHGLHSWAQAHLSWLARSHVAYGLEYTNGLYTWAVGDPPPENPDRYLDHPQLPSLFNAISLSLFGINDWAQRLGALIASLLTLPFLLALLRQLYGETTALIAGLVYVLFPISGYFYWIHTWLLPSVLLAFWCYFVLIGAFRHPPDPGKRHLFGLAIALFLMVQTNWAGFMFAAAIGTHYVIHCARNRALPDPGLFAVLLFTPFVSLAVVLGILIAARGGNYEQMIELYTWRSTLDDAPQRTVSAWWVNFFNLLRANFTLPALVIVIGWFFDALFRMIRRLAGGAGSHSNAEASAERSTEAGEARFTHAWVFLIPGVLYTAVFTEAMWVHEFKYEYFSWFVAIATALGVLRLRKVVARHHQGLANGVAAIALVAVAAYSMAGLNRFHDLEYYAPEKVALFDRLNGMLEPSQVLLSYESYVVQENPAKGAFYRPEVAWYLDREILVTRRLDEILIYARTGEYPYFLMANTRDPLFQEMKKRYFYTYIQGRPATTGKAGMSSYHIFHLGRPTGNQ